VVAAEDGDTAAPVVVVEEDFHFQWRWRVLVQTTRLMINNQMMIKHLTS
jgi:hypothetical protein